MITKSAEPLQNAMNDFALRHQTAKSVTVRDVCNYTKCLCKFPLIALRVTGAADHLKLTSGMTVRRT